MIIFNLDGTLANCEHRRHFVDPSKDADIIQMADGDWVYKANYPQEKYFWKPNWPAFYDACDYDTPIEPVIRMFRYQMTRYTSSDQKINWQIWSGRYESVRKKTEDWLDKYIITLGFGPDRLKMRPIGDNTPDDVLKERWLDEYLASMWPKLPPPEQGKDKVFYRKDPINFVFDSDPKSIAMWRRRGVFVFNCAQSTGEF